MVGVKDRRTNRVTARRVSRTDATALQGFVRENVAPGATLYTDEARAYAGMPEFEDEAVNHSLGDMSGVWRTSTGRRASGAC